MAQQTIKGGTTFAEGVTVGAYPATQIGPEGGPPSGAPAATATVTNGDLAFSGLTDDTDYVAYAASPNRYRRFRTSSGLPAGTAIPVPTATGVVATDWANISTAVAQARQVVAAGGIADVKFRGCPYNAGTLTPYAIGNNSIPIYAGVGYRGQPPVLVRTNPLGMLPDGHPSFIGGTVFQGDGTAPGMWDGAVDQAAPDSPDFLVKTIPQGRIYGLGFQNVSYGILSGAQNVQGIVYGEVDEIYVIDATQWGVFFSNFQHITFGKIFTWNFGAVGGQYYGTNFTPGGAQSPGDGNSVWRDLFHYTQTSPLSRGIVFEAAGLNTHLGSTHVFNLQNNTYNRVLQSDTATFTISSTSIGVPDGTKYKVGLPVWVTTTGNGFTLGRTYMVNSVAGNTITLATSKSTAAISATASGTLTLNSYGMPLVEVVGLGSTNACQGDHFEWLDLEGASTAPLYLENTSLGDYRLVSNATCQAMVVGRSVGYSKIRSDLAAWLDFDSNTAMSYEGALSGWRQTALPGRWQNSTLGLNEIGFGSVNGDIQQRTGGFLYPSGSGIGTKVGIGDSTQNPESMTNVGVIGCHTAGITRTLPTITDASVATGVPKDSCVGAIFEYVNVSGGTITIATNGTQTFNNIGALTSLVVPNQTMLRCIAYQRGAALYWIAYQVAIRTS